MVRSSAVARTGVILFGLILVGLVAWAILFVWGEQRLRLDLAELARRSRADMGFVVREPVRIGFKPDLVMVSGSFAMLSAPDRAFVADRPAVMLDEPVFRLSASRRSAVPLAQALDRPRDIETALESALLKFVDHGFAGLLIRNGRLLIVTEHGAEETVRDINLEVDARRRGSFRVVGTFNARSETFTIDALITPSFSREGSIEDRILAKVRLSAPSIDAVLDGRIELGFGLQVFGLLEAQLGTAERLAKWIDLAPGLAAPFSSAGVRGQLAWANGMLALSRSRFTFDSLEARGALQISFTGSKPMLEGTLGFTTVDLSHPFGFGIGAPGTNLAPMSDWASLPARLPWISDIDADLRLSADVVAFAGRPMGRAAGTLAIRSQNLLIDISELELADAYARVEVQVDQSAKMPRYTFRARFDEPQRSLVATELLGQGRLEGRTQLQVDLTGAGRVRGEVARDLAGRVILSMPSGARAGVDLKGLRAALREAVDRDVVLNGLFKGTSDLGRLDARLSIGRARARIDQLVAVADDLTITATGLVNVDAGELDMTLRLVPRSARPGDTRDTPVVSLTGTLRSPRVRVRVPASDTALQRPEAAPLSVRGVP
jgi:hypothetical protein